MGSIVTELQREALNSSVPIADLLRKALVVARKLKIKDFEKWIQEELNGQYTLESEIPKYRQVNGEVKAYNPYHGLVPVIFKDPKIAESLSVRSIGQPIGEIEMLVGTQGESEFCHVPFPKELQAKIMSGLNVPMPPMLIVGCSEMKGIIDAVRNIVLDWSLKLEEEGILGEDMSFSAEEKKSASNIHYNIHNVISNVSNSQIQQGTISSKQEIEITEDIKRDINLFISDLKNDLASLSLEKEEKDKIEGEMTSIENQLTQAKPKQSIVRSCLASIKTILEGAAGNVAGSLLLQKLLTLGLL